MQRVNGVVWGCFSGAHHQEVFTAIFRDVVNCAGGCAGSHPCLSDASQLKHQHRKTLPWSTFSCSPRAARAAHLGGAHDATDSHDGTQVYSGWIQGAWYCYVWSFLLARRRSSRPQGSAFRNVQRRQETRSVASPRSKQVGGSLIKSKSPYWDTAKGRVDCQSTRNAC